MANEYAVPQKRKRVIIICTRKDLGIDPEILYPEAVTKSENLQVTARETIGDLETVECVDTARYDDCDESDIVRFFKGKITYEEYILGRTPLQDDIVELGRITSDENGQLSFFN